MKIVATIADDRTPEGWEECFTATRHDSSYVDCRNQVERLIARYNASMRHPADLPRRLLNLRIEEIDSADAFNMGMGAFNKAKDAHENYWPADHPLHQEWRDGWHEAEKMANDDGEEDE